MARTRKKRRGLLLLGILLVAAGLAVVVAPDRMRAAEWLIRLWPVFLVCAGVVRVMGFAVERRPRSPVGGTLLIVIGILFLASRFHSDLNALQIYGRYWLLLLGVFATVELIRFYSHPVTAGPSPRLFTPWRLMLTLTIVITGVLANRVAVTNPSLLSALRLPGYLAGVRDSLIGENYRFTDQPVALADQGRRVRIENSYGDVTISAGPVFKAGLSKSVRAWNEADARRIADRIRLTTAQEEGGLLLATNRRELNHEFTTDLVVEVPPGVELVVKGAYGSIKLSGTEGAVKIDLTHGAVDIARQIGQVDLNLSFSDATLNEIKGDVLVKGARRVKAARVTGRVEVSASHGPVDLQDISGPVTAEAPFSRVRAQALDGDLLLRVEHGNIDARDVGSVSIDAPNTDVTVDGARGPVLVASSNSKVVLRNLAAEATVTGERCSVTASGVRAPLGIVTSHGSVTVKDFESALKVATSHRDVEVVADREPTGDIDVENSHGSVRLVLPSASRALLDAVSSGGRVRWVGFEDGGAALRSPAGTMAAPLIRLRTSYKNITIQATATRRAGSRT